MRLEHESVGMSASVCVCVYLHECVNKCVNTGAHRSLASGRELTNTRETEARPPNPQVRGHWTWH